jgi:hypothetical protein
MYYHAHRRHQITAINYVAHYQRRKHFKYSGHMYHKNAQSNKITEVLSTVPLNQDPASVEDSVGGASDSDASQGSDDVSDEGHAVRDDGHDDGSRGLCDENAEGNDEDDEDDKGDEDAPLIDMRRRKVT